MTRLIKVVVAAAAIAIGTVNPAVVLADDGVNSQVQEVLDHIAAHGVSVIHTSDGGAMVVIETNYTTRGVPELRVGLGRDGVFMPGTDLGTLRKITGLQTFKAPASVNIDDYDTLYIWDPRASAPISVAPLG